MPIISEELQRQVEAAYDYRGYVTLKLKSGEHVEGFLYNREFTNEKLLEDNFVEVMMKSGERKRYSIAAIDSVQLTGKDFAVPFEG